MSRSAWPRRIRHSCADAREPPPLVDERPRSRLPAPRPAAGDEAVNLPKDGVVEPGHRGDDGGDERVEAPPQVLVLVLLEAVHQRQESGSARGEEPPVVQAEQRREGEERLAAEHRATPLEEGDEGGEQAALVLGGERRASPGAEVRQTAVEQVEARLLHLGRRVAQTVDQDLDAVLVQHQVEHRRGVPCGPGQGGRRGAAQLLGLGAGHDRHQRTNRLLR
mmetsp:Transcript_6437/g.26193  ORF Transcript_6437/g.26193 Transcript_6437/m.26193 type:complete len:221 (-) Transcript_6437:1665-2327(-)